MFKLFVLFVITIIAQVIGIDQLLVLIAPVTAWLATFVANWIKTKLGTSGFMGNVLITMVVPAAALLGGWLTSLVVPEIPFLWAFLLAFGGVFINRFITEWTQTARGEQTAVLPTLTTLPKVIKAKL